MTSEIPNDLRYWRRLAFAALSLLLIDQFARPLLRRLETRRYETTEQFRFENADLFGLGPLVSWLRENPSRQRRRIVFLGNSVVYGYGLESSEAMPGQFHKMEAGSHVLNMAVNGSQLGTSYLVAKDTIDSVDALYVQVVGEEADTMLPTLIPVTDADARAFGLALPDALESRLRSLAAVWRMYALNYRFQAALLGTSTRHYLYLHRADLGPRLGALFHSRPQESPSPVDTAAPALAPDEPLTLRSPVRAQPPPPVRGIETRSRHPLMWRFGELVRQHRKRTVFLLIDPPDNRFTDEDVAEFNAAFAPFAEWMVVSIPARLKFDGRHLTPQGASVLAGLLSRHEMQFQERR